jgi:hypothetical protein
MSFHQMNGGGIGSVVVVAVGGRACAWHVAKL